MLLPNGKRKGNLFVAGGLTGEAGESLQVTIGGHAAGRFIDFAHPEDKGATPLWLWSKVKGIPFKQAVKDAADWLGVKDEDYGIKRHVQKEHEMPKPEDRNGLRVLEPNTPIMDYLVSERRIDPLVLANSKIAESKDGQWIVIPYFEKGDLEAFHIKKLKLERTNGKKEMFASKGTKRSLYGKHMIDDNTSDLIITEGEFDALSWHSVGYQAVSVPNGVSDMEWINIDWDWLNRFERVYVCFDMDDPGQAASQEVCKRLGLHRCYIVKTPCKDTNECLQEGLGREELTKCLASAKQIELDEIKRPDDFASEVVDLYETDFSKQGWDTPWYPQLPWRVRRSEFTVLSGFSGHGKTIALNQLMIHLVKQGARIMDASLEIKPGMTLFNMTKCAMAKRTSTRSEVQDCIAWLNESMFFLDCIGTVNVGRLMAAMEYARKRHGIDVFVIDSLFKCGLSSEDYGSQREFADKLTTFCNNTGAHVILVAHSRKVSTGNEYSIPTKSDVAGSSDICNAAFNVIIWWRNKLKKHKIDEAKQAVPMNTEAVVEWMDKEDGKIFLDKQRFGEGEEAVVYTWFDTETSQFHTCRNKKIDYFKSN